MPGLPRLHTYAPCLIHLYSSWRLSKPLRGARGTHTCGVWATKYTLRGATWVHTCGVWGDLVTREVLHQKVIVQLKLVA